MSWNARFTGTIAGYVEASGYVKISLFNHAYYAHRLAWLYETGESPKADIDHIDGNPSNNRIANLRPASRSENLANAKRRIDNTSGLKGVCWVPNKRKWKACIGDRGKLINIGFFDTIEMAAEAYKCEAISRFGKFARVE
jgi:hypothetical protein